MNNRNLTINLEVANKQLRIEPGYVMIWDKAVWDGEDQDVLDKLIETDDVYKFVGYDLVDGAPYYWNYPIAKVVDALNGILFPTTLLLIRYTDPETGVMTMNDGSRYIMMEDIMEYLQDVDCSANFYWTRQYLYDASGEVIGYEVAKA